MHMAANMRPMTAQVRQSLCHAGRIDGFSECFTSPLAWYRVPEISCKVHPGYSSATLCQICFQTIAVFRTASCSTAWVMESSSFWFWPPRTVSKGARAWGSS